MVERIRHCDVLVLAISPEALKSHASHAELDYAVSLHKPVIGVVVSSGFSDSLLPSTLSEAQLIDFTTPDRSTTASLKRALSSPPGHEIPVPPVPSSYLFAVREAIDSEDFLSSDRQSQLLEQMRDLVEAGQGRDDIAVLLDRLLNRDDITMKISEESAALRDMLQIGDD